MATGNTQVGYGTVFSWNSQAVAKLSKIGEFGFTVEKVDVSTFDATSAFKVVKAGLIDPGEFPIEGVMATDDANGQVAMFTDARARTSRTFIITLPTSLGTVTFTATGFISDIKIGEITPESIIPFKAKITITGASTLSIAA
jgi:hypothetical protein